MRVYMREYRANRRRPRPSLDSRPPPTHEASTQIATLYENHYRMIFRYIYSLSKNRSLTEDLTQDTFLKAFRALDKFDPSKGKVEAWLTVIVRNCFLQYNQKAEVRHHFDFDPSLILANASYSSFDRIC